MYHFLTKHTEHLYIYHMTWYMWTWTINFDSEMICSHFSSSHTTCCTSPLSIYNMTTCPIWVNITHVIVNFFTAQWIMWIQPLMQHLKVYRHLCHQTETILFEFFSHHQFVVYLNFVYQCVAKSEVLCFFCKLVGLWRCVGRKYELMAI